jgi:hypothetical protein
VNYAGPEKASSLLYSLLPMAKIQKWQKYYKMASSYFKPFFDLSHTTKSLMDDI